MNKILQDITKHDQDKEYKKNDIKLELVKRFLIKADRRQENMTTEYEIHPLTQELLYEEIGDDKVHRKNIRDLLKIISNMLPKDVLDIILYITRAAFKK